jgi:uncharacterized protein YbaR (Trm112 family)
MAEEWLCQIVRCPACAGDPGDDPGHLQLVAAKWLVCDDCGRKYPIRNRIPILLIEEGDRYRQTPLEELDAL